MSESLSELLAAAPRLQRAFLSALIALGSRPRSAALLRASSTLDQLAQIALSLGRYDDPEVGRALGWDAEAVVARGVALRRAEGRP